MTKHATRDDILPVILGGDTGVYPIGREFHEAYGIKSVCVVPEPISMVKNSRIFDVERTEALGKEDIVRAVTGLAERNPQKTLLLIANTDGMIKRISDVSSQLPSNVTCCVPPAGPMERVSNKVEFAKLCDEFGLLTPKTQVVDLSIPGDVAPSQIPFPLVAKPAVSAEYTSFIFKGCKKVYFVQSQEELDAVWSQMREVGFEGTFLVQELIPGDDTYMGSITLYVDSNGKTTMFGAAHVLLEDHSPSMLGNPVAMITHEVPELWRGTAAMLESIGWQGFANFDVKTDPRDGRELLFEVNPRIGRNSYYNLAGGVNPMECLVDDLVDGKAIEPRVVDQEVLYTMVPVSLLRRYVRDEKLKARLEQLIADGKVFDPQRYAEDRSLRRTTIVTLTEINQVRKFNRYYPKPTDTSF